MANGRVQLASVGLQDTFLTSEPQFTYFLKHYKKHTKFAMETIDNAFDGDVNFGTTFVCNVPRKGDLIHTMYFRFELGPLSSVSQPTSNIGYTDSIGNAIIEYADLLIGGQTVQRLTGEYMEIYDDIFVDNSQQTALQYMVGRTGTVNGLGSATAANGYPRLFIVPLPFYFYKNESRAIPLTSIDKQEVQVRIKLRSLNQLVVNVDDPTVSAPSDTVGSVTKASMPIEYVFLSDEEMKYLKSKPFDYVVTQLQLSRFTLDPGVTSTQMLLQFVNPVKEIHVVIQDGTVGSDVFNFKNSDTNSDQLSSLELTFNGETRLSKDIADALYLRVVQPMMCHTRTPTRYFYTYSFALNPEDAFPTGQVNMSRILSKLIDIKTTPSTKSREVRIYAVNYNILRVNGGLAGILFNDNNFI
jgi:hypothetical protein